MIGLPIMKFDTLVVTFFQLNSSILAAASACIGHSRVMLHHSVSSVLGTCCRVLQPLSDPTLRDDQLGVSNTRRADLETSSLELVLRIDLAKVLPRWGFAVTCRDRLFIQLDHLPNRVSGTHGMMRHLFGYVAISVRYGILERLAE